MAERDGKIKCTETARKLHYGALRAKLTAKGDKINTKLSTFCVQYLGLLAKTHA